MRSPIPDQAQGAAIELKRDHRRAFPHERPQRTGSRIVAVSRRFVKPSDHASLYTRWSQIWKKNPNLENILRYPMAAGFDFEFCDCQNARWRGKIGLVRQLSVDSCQLTVVRWERRLRSSVSCLAVPGAFRAARGGWAVSTDYSVLSAEPADPARNLESGTADHCQQKTAGQQPVPCARLPSREQLSKCGLSAGRGHSPVFRVAERRLMPLTTDADSRLETCSTNRRQIVSK